MVEKKYLNLGRKIAYGSGDFASNFSFTFVSSFVMLYLTNVVGLNSAIVGILMMVSKLLDGITDVLVGNLIDRTRTKMGKARPWMFWSTFPLAVCVILQFSIPDMGKGLQYAYFFVIYTLMNAIFYTANNIAYSTISALITKNPNERVSLGAYRFVFALIAAMGISSVTAILVEKFGGGAAGWRNVAILYAAILVAINTISVLSVKEIPEEEFYTEEPEEQKGKLGLLETLKYLVKNKYFWLILTLYLLINLMSGISNSVGIYFVTYNLGNSSLLGIFSMAGMLPMMLGIMVTPFFAKKWGMYRTICISMVAGIVFFVPYIFFGMRLEVVPMAVLMALRSVCMGPLTCSMNALIAETAKYSYLTQGVHMEGALRMISFMYVIVPGIVLVLQTICAYALKVEKANKELEEKKA